MQLWCLPLLLLTAERWREMPGLRRGLEVLAAATLMGFTSPSIGLVAPVALGTWLALRTTWSRTGVALAVGTLAITALGLAIPWAMHTVDISGTAGLVPAAPVPGLQHPPALSPVATLGSLFMATGPWDGSHAAINNIAGLGAPALLSAAAALLMAWRKMALAGALVVAGAVFALGPTIEAFGFKWLMPAYLMEITRYPITESGMYYRFSQVATLGLALAVCRLGQALPRHAVPSVLVIAGINLAENVRETSRLWPRSLTAIPNAETSWSPWLKTRPKAPSWSLPLAHLDTEGERRLLGQAHSSTTDHRPGTQYGRAGPTPTGATRATVDRCRGAPSSGVPLRPAPQSGSSSPSARPASRPRSDPVRDHANSGCGWYRERGDD